MNNFTNSIKRFFKNKNTVTILGVVLVIGILYFGYKYEIKKAVDPVTGIPVATQDIQPRTLITADMVSTVDIAPIMLNDKVITSTALVVGKYSNYNTMIPEGSLFFNGVVVNKEDLPNASLVNVKEGEVVFPFPVDMDLTYGNSMMPNTLVDIYMKATDDDGKVMVGKLLSNVEILAVKDAEGRNVFENTAEAREPAYLYFGFKQNVFLLMKKATYLYDVELFPVPMGQKVNVESSTQVSTEQLKNYIEARTITVSEDEIINGADNNSTKNGTDNNTTNNTGDNNTNGTTR